MADKKHITLIEAERDFANILKNELTKKGFEVDTFPNGDDGLDFIKKNVTDLIVLCVELPETSGYSICNKLKKDSKLKSIPLILISSEATPETFEQHKKLKTHAEEYLIKPFEPKELIERIKNLIGLPEQQEGSEEEIELSLDDVDIKEETAQPQESQEEEVHLSEEDLSNLVVEDAPSEESHQKADGDIFKEDDLNALDNAFNDIKEPVATAEDPSLDISIEEELKKDGISAEDFSIESDSTDIDKQLDSLKGDLGDLSIEEKPEEKEEVVIPKTHESVDNKKLKTLEEENKNLLSEINSLKKQLEELRVSQKSKDSSSSSATAELNNRLKQKEKELQEEIAKRQKLDSQVTELMTQIASKQEEIHNLQEEMEKKDREADERLASLMEQLANLQNEIESHKKDAQETKGKAQEFEKLIKTKDSVIKELEMKINDLQKQVNELAPFKFESEDLKKQISETKEKLLHMEADKKSVEDDLNQLRDDKAALESAFELERNQFAEEKKALEEEKKALEEKANKLMNKLRIEEKVKEKIKKAVEIAYQLLSEKKEHDSQM